MATDCIVLTQMADVVFLDHAPEEAEVSGALLCPSPFMSLEIAPGSILTFTVVNGKVAYEIVDHDPRRDVYTVRKRPDADF